MTGSSKRPPRPLFLGIEGGGTHTVALLADASRRFVQRFETSPANIKLINDAQLAHLFRAIAAEFPGPDSVAVGLAGARGEPDLERIRAAAGRVWQGIPCAATNDLETALSAASHRNGHVPNASILVLSGTGSCCYGRNAAGKAARIGGWGHILGDKGSGYEIGLRALKATVFYFDHKGVWSRLGQQLLQRLQLNEPNELIAWVQAADKSSIAALALEVFSAWKKGDRIARDILEGAQASLAEDAVACAKQLARTGSVQFILAGSVLLKQPRFARKLGERLRKLWPSATVKALERESVWGAVVLAEKTWNDIPRSLPAVKPARTIVLSKESDQVEEPAPSPGVLLSQIARLSPTEQRNPRSLNFDKLALRDAISLMLSEDARIPQAIMAERVKIERAVRLIARAFKAGGRLFYVGAGTSGRLGVLDASECPPTFRTDPEMVQGIIAGGQGALWRSVEGAEDDSDAGVTAMRFRRVNRRDVVVGIAASGRTPFVWGALAEAKRRGAQTILLGFNPFFKITGSARPTLIITPNVGPELLTGSTRLKAGTATKLILNIFTTLAMVRIGKVIGNLMVDLNPSNTKLRDRAVRIVQDLQGVDYNTAQAALERSGWVIKRACQRLKQKSSRGNQ